MGTINTALDIQSRADQREKDWLAALDKAARATAKASPVEAIHIYAQGFPLSGDCNAAQPFGQSTAYLSDGTPVDRNKYILAALQRAAKVWKGVK